VFFVFSLILLVIFVILTAVFSNVFETLTAETALAAEAAKFTIIEHIMDQLPIIFVVMGGILVIVMFAKIRGGGGGMEA